LIGLEERAYFQVKSLVEARRNTFKSPKPDASRLLAFDLLSEVNRNGGFSNLLLPQALSASSLDERDRSFVTELLYGTLRMQGKHDWVLSQISDRPWSEVDAGIVDIARMGVHQIHEMRVPDQQLRLRANALVNQKRVSSMHYLEMSLGHR
jgi:16S rRNA (cytosine967-C5)-methyltransferase